jgi:hypothetical protein
MEGQAPPVEWDDETFERILEQVRNGGKIDASRVRIRAERREGILEAAPEDPKRPGRRMLKKLTSPG